MNECIANEMELIYLFFFFRNVFRLQTVLTLLVQAAHPLSIVNENAPAGYYILHEKVVN